MLDEVGLGPGFAFNAFFEQLALEVLQLLFVPAAELDRPGALAGTGQVVGIELGADDVHAFAELPQVDLVQGTGDFGQQDLVDFRSLVAEFLQRLQR